MNEGQNGGFNGSAVNFGAQNNAGAQPAAGQAARPLIPGGRRSVQTVPVRTMPPQSAPAMTNMTPSPSRPAASPFGQQPIMSSGEGDVILGGGAPEKRSRGGVIALVVLVILVALAGGGYALWQSGVLGGGGGSSVAGASNMKEAYNAYVNYVLFGVESNGAPDLEAIEDAQPYFESLNSGAKSEYVEKAGQKYDDLAAKYEEYEGNVDVNVAVLKSYFVDYAGFAPLDEAAILKEYLDKGAPETQDTINAHYAETGGEEYWDNYLVAGRQQAEALLTLVTSENNAGCIQNEKLVQGCFVPSNEEGQALSDGVAAVMNATGRMYVQAMDALEVLYADLYGMNENNGGEE